MLAKASFTNTPLKLRVSDISKTLVVGIKLCYCTTDMNDNSDPLHITIFSSGSKLGNANKKKQSNIII